MTSKLVMLGIAFAPLAIGALADTTPRQIADLGRAGFLAEPTGELPELTSVAGARFLELVPDSKKEVCRMVLEYHARAKRGTYRLRVVDERGREIMVCSL